VRRDSGGSIVTIPGSSDAVVYFLSNQHASVSVAIELDCDNEFAGAITVSSWVLFIENFLPEHLVNIGYRVSTRDSCAILNRLYSTVTSVELNPRGVAKYSDFEPIEGYISETVQDMR